MSVRGCLLQQVPCQACLRPLQARRSLRHHAHDGAELVEALLVERFHGVGPATAAKTEELGIFTALDLRAKDEAFLLEHFGKAGRHFYCICRGIDLRPVLPNRVRKSVGAENTFSRDLTSPDDLRAELSPLVDKVWHYCDSTGVRGRTVTLKVKFADFKIITRSQSPSRRFPTARCWHQSAPSYWRPSFRSGREFVSSACRFLRCASIRQTSIRK